jgi:hypothetical protein
MMIEEMVQQIAQEHKDGADEVMRKLHRKLCTRLESYDELMAHEVEPFSWQGEVAIMILCQIVNDLKQVGISNK